MSTVNTPGEDPREVEDQSAATSEMVTEPDGAVSSATESSGAPTVAPRLAFTSVPALLTSLVLSVTLFISVLYGWYAIGPEIRAQISGIQAITLLVVALGMLAILMSIGYSRLYADERGVVIRNGPVRRKFSVDQVAGIRLRDGDPWAYLLVKNDEGGVRRRAVLAIQQLEGARGKRKITQVRRWLKANGATSQGITLTED